ncbi:golgin-45-like [Acipenser ruthenus]|uniref:golgin-45-like n=1 Tax=Acipenser ruthenus TaxID=7906 RepID=UPI00145B0E2C|nr:golgin-45-like [Acipenser ruthenus]XP_058884873.1 golgin-45-like [Acipenser ruthenus]
MTSVQQVKAPATVPVRGPGDGMETDEPSKSLEVITELPCKSSPIQLGPRTKPAPPQNPGVLHLGRIQKDLSIELEAIRIVVPRAAISHTIPSKGSRLTELAGHQKIEPVHSEAAIDSRREGQELKATLDKLQNSERRLLQDKEGLSNQLRVQTEVNRELKKLLVASVGDDLQYHFERLAREKNQLILENETLGRNLTQISEQLERMTIQCDVWRSKFLASRVMAEELTNARTALQRQTREAQGAIQDLLSEREEFSRDMSETHRSLEQLLVSLQWGRQQTYYPSAQPLTTGELAAANQKLAKAVNSQLLGNLDTSISQKMSPPTVICNTPAEKMAEKVLRILDPVLCTEDASEVSFSEPLPTPFLSNKKSIGRFHPYTRYENITFNCCNRCSGELIVL